MSEFKCPSCSSFFPCPFLTFACHPNPPLFTALQTSKQGPSHLHLAVNPTKELGDLGIDAWLVLLTTASSPAGDPSQVPSITILTNQGATTVALGKERQALESWGSQSPPTISVFGNLYH